MPEQTIRQFKIELRVAGFTEYKDRDFVPLHYIHAESKWQLKVCNKNGKIKYFVHAFLYERVKNTPLPNTIEFEVTLYQEMRDNECITLQLHGSNVKSALYFFGDAYTDLCCELDRHNN